MSNPVMDVEEFLDRVQDDKELFLELLDIYEEDYAVKREDLEKKIAEKNYEEIRGIAHSLKGASGNISAKAIREIFLQMEDSAKKNDLSLELFNLQALDEQYAVLKTKMDELRKEFQQ